MTTATPSAERPIERRFERPPRVPHTVHLRELEMPDGRKLLLDRRAVAFLCESKPAEFPGMEVTIIAFRTQAKACPVKGNYQDLKAWWFGNAAANGKAA